MIPRGFAFLEVHASVGVPARSHVGTAMQLEREGSNSTRSAHASCPGAPAARGGGCGHPGASPRRGFYGTSASVHRSGRSRKGEPGCAAGASQHSGAGAGAGSAPLGALPPSLWLQHGHRGQVRAGSSRAPCGDAGVEPAPRAAVGARTASESRPFFFPFLYLAVTF